MTQKMTGTARLRRLASRSVRPIQAVVRRALLHTADNFLLSRPAKPNAQRVLLVRLDNIGDFVVWLDAARALTEHFRSRGQSVSLLASGSWAELAADLGLFDEVIALDQHNFKRKLRYRLGLLSSIRAAGFGVVVQPTLNRVPEMGDAVVRMSGATERIGVALPQERQLVAGTALYTKLIQMPAEGMGELQANAYVVSELTGADYQATVGDLRAVVDAECLGELATTLPARPYVVLFPGASAPGRQWPEQHFAELARRCAEDVGLPVVICGGPGDVKIAEAAASTAGPSVVSVAGRTSLKQLTTVIARAHLLVSNETSAVHIAAAVGVPSVCIVGGGHFGRFVPYDLFSSALRPLPVVASRNMECFGCNWVCKFHPARGKPMPCVEQVSVDSVWQLAASLLSPLGQEVEA